MGKRRTKKGVLLKKCEYEKANGQFEYRYKDYSGKLVSVYAKSLPELRDKEKKIQFDILEGIKTNYNITLNDAYETWRKTKRGIKATTMRSYELPYDRYVRKELGNTPLSRLTYSRIKTFYNDLSQEKGLKLASIKNVSKVIQQALDVAVRDGYLRNNPAKGALSELQRELDDSKKVIALTKEQQAIFEKYMAQPGRYHKWEPIFIFLLNTGLRIGEALALTWDDVSFEKEIIYVKHTLAYYPTNDGCIFAITEPKTKASKRTVPMLSKTRELLLQIKKHQVANNITSERIDGVSGFVFVSNEGKVLSYKKLNGRLEVICKDINKQFGIDFPRISNHVFRHTFATRMLEAGANPKVIGDVLGQEDIIKTTLKVYVNSDDELKKHEMNKLCVFLPQNLPQN